LILYELINGYGKLTETENVIYIFTQATEFLRTFATKQRRYGYGSTAT